MTTTIPYLKKIKKELEADLPQINDPDEIKKCNQAINPLDTIIKVKKGEG